MADIEIVRRHSFDRQEVKRRVEQFAGDLKNGSLASVKVDYDWNPTGDRVDFTGKGFKGTIELMPDAVRFNLSLGLLLRPFAGKIEKGVESSLDRLFG